MERVYKHEGGYIVVREHEDGAFTTYLFGKDGKEVLDGRGRGVGGTYKSLESALRYASRKAGTSWVEPWEATSTEERFGLLFIGNAERGNAGGIIQEDMHGDEVGLWHLTVSVRPCYEYAGENLGTKEVREFATEEEAWAAFDAVCLRTTNAYEARKTLTTVVRFERDLNPITSVMVASEEYMGWAHHSDRDWFGEREAQR